MNYLDYEVTNLPNSTEDLFCKPLDKNGKKIPLSEMEARVLMLAISSTDEQINEIYNELKSKYNLMLILEDRLEALNCKFDIRAIIASAIFCSTPGEAVMYANYIAYKVKTSPYDIFDTDAFCHYVFPYGKFTNDTLSEYWDKQKVSTGENIGSDNLLDYQKASESISK